MWVAGEHRQTPDPVEIQRRADERSSFATLLSGVLVIFVFFLVYNAIAFEGMVRVVAVVHDCALLLTVAMLLMGVRRGWVVDRYINLARALVILFVVSNVGIVSAMQEDILHTTDFALLLVGIGAFMRSARGALVCAALTFLAWVLALSSHAMGIQWYLLLFSSFMVGGIFFVVRYRSAQTIDNLRRSEWLQRAELESALEESQALRLELDERVATRTRELTQAMESLRKEYDVREKLAEQLRHAQRLEIVGSLAGSVAHDFNNQLTVIQAGAEIASSMSDDEELLANLEDVKYAADRAAAITQQLLFFSRKQVEEPRVVNLSEAVFGLQRTLIRLIHQAVTLEFILPEEPVSVLIDPVQLEQIIVNLVVNARDASPQGHVIVSVQERRDESGRVALLQVEDNGAGMSADTMAQIFEPFFTTKSAGKGTGLGLATVQRIVRRHAGEVSVESEVGVGTTFTIVLPIAVQEVAMEHQEAQETGVVRTILTVDDQPQVLKMAVALFKNLGFEVIAANSGAEALEIARQMTQPIDILWTDVLMPEMNGRELAVRFHELYPEAPVVFASGFTANVLGDGKLPDYATFVAKPYSLRTVSEALGRLGARSSHSEEGHGTA